MGEPMVCTGCGGTWSDEALAAARQADPRVLSCCPERHMVTVEENRARLNSLDERMNRRLAELPDRVTFANARRIATPRVKRATNVALAMELFGLGSTYAAELCRRVGLDPWATTSDGKEGDH